MFETQKDDLAVNNSKNENIKSCTFMKRDFAKGDSGTCTVQQSTPRSITNHVIPQLASWIVLKKSFLSNRSLSKSTCDDVVVTAAQLCESAH